MPRLSLPYLVAAALAATPATAAAQALQCVAGPERDAAQIGGEVAGQHGLSVAFGPGLEFRLEPVSHGWEIQVRDASGADLSAMTPPLRTDTNPRFLYGWHFRNAANTAANDGSVNAPQEMRAFVFGPVPTIDGPAPGEGRGMLRIRDYGLADLEPGQQARMVYLTFETCLNWPLSTEDKIAGTADLVPPELAAQFQACGLAAPLALSPYLAPASLIGDFDGDRSLDIAAPIARSGDGKRGLALCRGGKTLDILGLEGAMGELVPAYFDHITYWALHETAQPVGLGATGGTPPTLKGDAILLGKEDSSSVLLYWAGSEYNSYWQGD